MAMRLGANPIGWSNDDLGEIGGETSLETCLAEAREAGFGSCSKPNRTRRKRRRFPTPRKASRI
jgi:hypothetical protein